MRQNVAWFFLFLILFPPLPFSLCLFFSIFSSLFLLRSDPSSPFFLLQDGAFLIRHSSNLSPRQPYTLAVLYQQKVYNIPIRFLEEMQGYALGKEGKKTEEVREKKERRGKSWVGSGVAGWFFFIINWLFSLFYGLLRFSATWTRWFPIISTISCSS